MFNIIYVCVIVYVYKCDDLFYGYFSNLKFDFNIHIRRRNNLKRL